MNKLDFNVPMEIELRLVSELNRIVSEQTEDGEYYSINLRSIAKKIAIPLLAIIPNVVPNAAWDLIKYGVQEFYTAIEQVQEEECIQISEDDRKKLIVIVLSHDKRLSDSDINKLIENYSELEHNTISNGH